ncbi:MAG: biopolymer transporter ExbD [Candidatus Tectomicrobia bacterium]|uniref:Biopolymer transporter ExbD n=1 Tax=Tectimicrobiota bacterium TaxID=2528274 RepID=A0A933GLM4_UNCTE|nr:biopolymer transporter ExbD [Candidatus Tectomicrobia bacterium]
MRFRLKRRPDVRIEVINLIDIMLMILLFFMITTTFVVQPGIPVTLPKASSSVKIAGKEIVVVISADESIYFQGQKVSLEQLPAILKSAVENNKDNILLINADEKASHGTVVAALDAAKALGIERLAIATKYKEAK